MKKLCKAHHLKHEHKLCKTHGSNACEIHKALVDEGKTPEDKKSARAKRASGPKGERGVHAAVLNDPGTSVMGTHVKKPMAGSDYSKKMARLHSNVVLNEMKNIKPNLGKSEDFQESNEPQEEDCPYCEKAVDDHSDCPYCQELDAEQGDDHSDCPYCVALDSEQAGGVDGCPYCQEIPPQENVSLQDHQCNCPNCPQSEPANADISNPADIQPEHPADCPECQKMYGEAVENQPGQTGQEPPKTQGHETAQEVLDLLDQEPGTGNITPTDASRAIDNTEMPQGDAMEENTSTTENFGESTKGDISDEEQGFGGENDQPDMTSVLQSGLDDHAQEQKKQQVLDMVGQTLQGFKANKAFLEQAKEQNPGLYQSTIQMLKAMVSLCDLLGLRPPMQQTPAVPVAPSQTPAPAAQGEAAQDPKTQAGLVR